MPINEETCVCSEHFVNAAGRLLRINEVPSLKLPFFSSSTTNRRKSPKVRRCLTNDLVTVSPGTSCSAVTCSVDMASVGVRTDETELASTEEVSALKETIKKKDEELKKQNFRLQNICDDDAQVLFYTGFHSHALLKIFFNFLGPNANKLIYSQRNVSGNDQCSDLARKGRPRLLSPMEEMFLTLVCLRLGLMEQDLAYRFGISQSTSSRIIITWINFMYLQLKTIPLWPPKEVIHSNMPAAFKEKYPTTRVVIDATEVYIDQPKLPEIQQMTFSNYKNNNTYKGLKGISPDGVVIFISSLYPGSISDKELTRKCGILDLLEPGDSVMADCGFDIEENLILRGIHLNIPPFLRGKQQFSQEELITTRRIASLRIHVERAMERIKNFHIFGRSLPVTLTDIADRLFFVCCALTNFQPSLCNK